MKTLILFLLLVPFSLATGPDVNNDNLINIFDLVLIARNIGSTNNAFDINEDGFVNVFDLMFVVRNIGLPPPPIDSGVESVEQDLNELDQIEDELQDFTW